VIFAPDRTEIPAFICSFPDSSSLIKRVDIPDSVKTIRQYAFVAVNVTQNRQEAGTLIMAFYKRNGQMIEVAQSAIPTESFSKDQTLCLNMTDASGPFDYLKTPSFSALKEMTEF